MTPLLQLRDIRLPLAEFPLCVDAEFAGPSIGIFGASGAGKTSLLDLVAGLRRAPSARIVVAGQTLVDTSAGIWLPPERRHVGYVPQDGALFPHLDVRQNLLFGARTMANSAQPPEQWEHVLQVLEIGSLIGRRIDQLSGGEQQRVALGRALLCDPRILLLDEPLAGLDARLKDRVLPYLQLVRIEFRLPMLYVSHAPREVMTLCDEVLVLDAGRELVRGRPDEIFVPVKSPRYELSLPRANGEAFSA